VGLDKFIPELPSYHNSLISSFQVVGVVGCEPLDLGRKILIQKNQYIFLYNSIGRMIAF
jgi:hypothetical protein